MNPITLFGISIGILLFGSVVTLILGKSRHILGQITFGFILLAAICIYYVVFHVFMNGPISSEGSLWNVPGINASFVLRIDYLSALFLAIIAMISVLVSLYSVSFMKLAVFKDLSLRAFYPILLIFFAGVMCVVAVADMFFFFIFW